MGPTDRSGTASPSGTGHRPPALLSRRATAGSDNPLVRRDQCAVREPRSGLDNSVHRRLFEVAVALLAAVVVGGGVATSASGQTWRDKLNEATNKTKDAVREKTEEIKRKTKESEHPCADCGKTIHVGSVCASCAARRASQQAKQATDQAREAWRRSEPQRKALEQKAREAPTKAKDASRRAIERGQELWRSTADHRQRMAHDLRAASDEVRLTAERVYQDREDIARRVTDASRKTWERANAAAQEYLPRIRATISDPEVQRRAIEAIGAGIALHQQLRESERQFVYHSLRATGALRVQTANGTMSLEDAFRRRLVDRFPVLNGSSLADDPAFVLTALVTGDQDYFLREMKIVPTAAGTVSVIEAVDQSTAFGASKTLAYLDLLQATEDLHLAAASGEGAVDAITNLALSVQEVRRIENR